MNHDFDNEFETDDELKEGAAAEKTEGNTLLPDLPAEQAVQEEAAGPQGRQPGPEKPLKDHYHFIVAEIIALALIGAGWYGKRMMSLMQTDTEFNKSDMTNPYISVEKSRL